MLSGKVVDKTLNAGAPPPSTGATTYLYRDGSDFVFMDSQDCERHRCPEAWSGTRHGFLLEGMPVQVAFHNGVPLLTSELPVTVELESSHRRARLAGRPVQRGRKPATRQTGPRSSMPLFINTGTN